MREPYHFSDWQAGKRPPKGWDAADAVDDGWGKDELDAFMKATVRPWSPPDADKSPAPPAERPSAPAGPTTPATQKKPVAEARTTQQAHPESATVTQLHTRKTVRADDSWELQLVTNEEGKTKPGVAKNWALFIENHPDMRDVFAFDAFKMSVMLMRAPPWERNKDGFTPRSLQDSDYAECAMWLEGKYMTPKASTIAPIIHAVAGRNQFDRLREYLDGLKWDGQKRVENWLSYYFGVEDTPYARTVGRGWLVSSVARGLTPGAKVDTMPILEGVQGLFKSTAVKALYGAEFFSDNLSDIGSKDAMMELQGVWGLEVAEMHRFSAAETNAVKKFLTRVEDRFRPPYGKSVVNVPRRVVMVGTINPEGNAYLRDPTGARRFWPLTCTAIDLDAIAADRDQLWAEAIELYKAGVPWWVQEDELQDVLVEQDKRTDVDVWFDLIAPLLAGKRRISRLDILVGLNVPHKDAGWQHSSRIGRIMKKLGWIERRERTKEADETVFYHPDFVGKPDGW